jgi:hypothetical protein
MILQHLVPLNSRGGSGGAFTVTIKPASVYYYNPTGGTSGTTRSVTATATGGTAPYTYAWTGAASATFTISSAAAATTTFSGDGVGSFSDVTEIKRCTVTDNVAAVAFATVSVEMQFGGSSGGGGPIQKKPIVPPRLPR